MMYQQHLNVKYPNFTRRRETREPSESLPSSHIDERKKMMMMPPPLTSPSNEGNKKKHKLNLKI
jgi:hypothetical protein